MKICFLCAAEPAAAKTRMQQHLQKLESDLAAGMNVVLKTDEQQGSFQIGRIVKGPYTTLGRKELDGEYAGAGSRLVDVEVYAEEKVLRRRGTGRVRARAMGIDYLSRKPAGSCDKLYCKCGPALGCFKQHVTTFRLKQVREPIGFRLIAPRARRVCVQSTEPLRYQLDDLTRQRIAASLDIV